MRTKFLCFVPAILILLSSCHKDPHTYVFTGHVYHSTTSAPIIGARVIIHEHYDHGHLDGINLGQTTTDQNGNYSFTSNDLQDGFTEMYVQVEFSGGSGGATCPHLSSSNTIDVPCNP